jgi:TIR domain
VESPSVFLSHAHEDNSLARQLAAGLTQRGVQVWVDECELRIGDSIIERVSEAIAEGDFLLAIISPASLLSGWCKHELALAATRGRERVSVAAVRSVPSTSRARRRSAGGFTLLASLRARRSASAD